MKALTTKNNPLKYAPLALAGAAAMVSTGANATIISSVGLNQDVANGTTVVDIGGMGVAIYRDATTDFAGLSFVSSVSVAAPLSAGTVIGSSLGYGSYGWLSSGNSVYKTGLFGVQFDNGDGNQYGWIDIEVVASTTNPVTDVTLHGWGYENEAGVSIKAGEVAAVNAPAGLALLAVGALGLVASRRRKTKAA